MEGLYLGLSILGRKRTLLIKGVITPSVSLAGFRADMPLDGWSRSQVTDLANCSVRLLPGQRSHSLYQKGGLPLVNSYNDPTII